ncbi:trafficking protein particle complex subunit 12 [Apiospora phragmitis]|uniref:Trafficking protein particle complex subunit 12 n=1 Tax=Apiospora phragmitis TaxID=2905665 RepID=A0ABR1VIC6_9PEZI
MDDYPAGSLDHNAPLLVVSGLGTGATKPLLADPDLKERGTLIRSELPLIDGREAKAILHCIQEADATSWPWNPTETTKKYRFKIKTIGREFLLPPRRARLPEDYEAPLSPPVLHSPFSPLSPGSTLYPDGLIDARWLAKHQEFIPSICLSFYSLTSDPSLATLNDNQLKTDINAVKHALSQSGHKTRLAVVILSDQAPGAMEPFQERLENIRRSTGLDPKTSLFVLPTKRSEAELEVAADSVLSSVFMQATEYYRDLSRRTRKKRGRGVAPQPTIPPTSGTSHTLSLQGWNVRYDFKAAVFAEFRQDMEAALRSYEQAYESLFGTDVLETVPSWSPRFNDGRLLADVIAVRILRCLFWTGQSTAGVRRWQAHRYKLSDFLDQRGRGTQNYGWQAWESRWAEVMAQLVEKAKFPELEPSSLNLFRPPEKALSAERLQPWEMLHHPGYWYRISARHTLDRRKLAYSILKMPGSHQTQPYEEYPLEGQGTVHAQKVLTHLYLAIGEFQKRKQKRLAVEVALESSVELERIGAWKQLLEFLTPLWRTISFRSESWWNLTEALSWILRNAAARAGQADLVLAIDWELMNSRYNRRPQWQYDINKSLEGVEVEEAPELSLNDDAITSFLESSFVFKHGEGRAGQTCPAQLAITSKAFSGSTPVVLDEIRVEFEGSLRALHLEHESSSPKQTSSEPRGMVGHDDLTIAPGQTRVFEVDVPLREAGEGKATSVRVTLAPEAFTLNYTMKLREDNSTGVWYVAPAKRRVTRPNPLSIKVLPRPPKMEVKFVNVLKQYYAGEPIHVEVQLINEEDVDANTKLDVHLYGQDVPHFKAHAEDGSEDLSSAGEGEEAKLDGPAIGTIEASKSAKATVIIDPINRPTAYDLTIKAWYTLVTDPGTHIVQIVAFQLNIVNPFEASYDLVPRLHSDPWPSVFDYEAIKELDDNDGSFSRPRGLAQKWCLITRFGSFATEDLRVVDLDLQVKGTQGDVVCSASKNQTLPEDGILMAPKIMDEARFDLVAQKLSLDDRNPSTADLEFMVRWRRTSADPASTPNATTFLLDPFYVTVAEPRVLASVYYSVASSPSSSKSTTPSTPSLSSTSPQIIILDITIENPSSHFLTFGLTMEPSDEFAFSGAKTTSLNVLPVARRTVTYRLLPVVEGGSWIKPQIVVRDKYFQKVLKIIPTEGMKRQGDSIMIWVPGQDADDEKGEETSEE